MSCLPWFSPGEIRNCERLGTRGIIWTANDREWEMRIAADEADARGPVSPASQIIWFTVEQKLNISVIRSLQYKWSSSCCDAKTFESWHQFPSEIRRHLHDSRLLKVGTTDHANVANDLAESSLIRVISVLFRLVPATTEKELRGHYYYRREHAISCEALRLLKSSRSAGLWSPTCNAYNPLTPNLNFAQSRLDGFRGMNRMRSSRRATLLTHISD